jgi:hypothetical protein
MTAKTRAAAGREGNNAVRKSFRSGSHTLLAGYMDQVADQALFDSVVDLRESCH